VELGAKKDYQLVCHTGNCFFVRKELVPGLQLDPALLESPDNLFNYGKHYRERVIDIGRKILPERIMNLIFNASLKWKHFRRKR
jgi:hypothetical protein